MLYWNLQSVGSLFKDEHILSIFLFISLTSSNNISVILTLISMHLLNFREKKNLLLSLHSVLCLLPSVLVFWITLRRTIDFVPSNYYFFSLWHLTMVPTSVERLSMEEWVQLLWWDFGLHSMEDDSKTQHLWISQLYSNKRGRFILFQRLTCIINCSLTTGAFLWFQYELDQYGEWKERDNSSQQ